MRGRDESGLREVRVGKDEVVLLRGEGVAEDDGVELGDLPGARGGVRHGLHVAEIPRPQVGRPHGSAAGRGGSVREKPLSVGEAEAEAEARGAGERGGS